MAYRGEDLDLRSLSGRSARDPFTSPDVGLNGSRARGSTVYVDDTVMVCCNHAYDIAQAHGAHEVRLEHLVHALTRVEAAAETLERRGIREAHLRRESAAVIAADIPMGLNQSNGPRASSDFETVLRRASDQASARGTSATVDDLLWVLLNFDRDNAAVALLQRHALNWQQWEWPHRRERAVERSVERATAPTAAGPHVNAVNFDAVLHRLNDMESSVRALHAEVSSDRRMLADLMRDLRRELSTPRADMKLPQSLVDRLHGVEDKVELRFDQLGRTMASIETRVDALQRAPVSPVTIPPQMFDRLGAIERAIEQRGTESNATWVQALNDRLSAVETSITTSSSEGARHWHALTERLKNVDRLLTTTQSGAGNVNSTELMLLAEQVQGAATHTQNVNDRLSALERIVTERFGGIERVATERQSTLEKRLVEQTAHMERTLGDRLIAAERNQLDRLGEIQKFVTGFEERMTSATGGGKGVVTLLDTHSQQMQTTLKSALTNLAQPLIERMAQVEQVVERQQAQAAYTINTLVEKSTSTVHETSAQHARELGELHEALVQLGQNQKALAEALDHWRQESAGDLGVIGNRLAHMEKSASVPSATMQQLQRDIEGLQRVTLADYDKNRRGIRQWLFGTDDMFAGSWRDDTAQLRARLRERETVAPTVEAEVHTISTSSQSPKP